MMNSKKYIKNEEGSATIEFLGILPFILLVLVIMWQLIVTIHAVILVQSAANEAGKVYSLTKDSSVASAAASDIISAGGSYLSFQNAPISGEKKYTATVNALFISSFSPKSILVRRLLTPFHLLLRAG